MKFTTLEEQFDDRRAGMNHVIDAFVDRYGIVEQSPDDHPSPWIAYEPDKASAAWLDEQSGIHYRVTVVDNITRATHKEDGHRHTDLTELLEDGTVTFTNPIYTVAAQAWLEPDDQSDLITCNTGNTDHREDGAGTADAAAPIRVPDWEDGRLTYNVDSLDAAQNTLNRLYEHVLDPLDTQDLDRLMY